MKKYTARIEVPKSSKNGTSSRITNRQKSSRPGNTSTYSSWKLNQSNSTRAKDSFQSKLAARENIRSNNRSKSSFVIDPVGANPKKRKISKKFRKVLIGIGIGALVLLLFLILGGMYYLQSITQNLPDPDQPFKDDFTNQEASVMLDRNGKELYRLFGDANKDVIRIPDGQTFNEVISPELKWSFLAAEDINFYEHPGFDVTAIARCGARYVTGGGGSCGGSTITQQVVKLVGLKNDTQSLERKLQELILSLQLENKVNSKDKILLLYMNIAPEGGNMYGIKTAANSYFGKELNDLTLSEAAVLAAIPNNPSLFSPTRTKNTEAATKRLDERRTYILGQMLKNKEKINADVRSSRQAKADKEGRELTDAEKEDFITEEKITVASAEELTYKDLGQEIKAGHFVFYAMSELTERSYNNGTIFTDEEIRRGGYKITTSLDLDIQNTALDVVQKKAVDVYGKQYGSKNSAFTFLSSKTGEIIAMVGSKCYDDSELANCSQLDKDQGKSFDSKVNILTSLQQPGSSIKPLVYYEAIKEGKLSAGTVMADIPVEIGSYKPKNSDGKFSGMNSARLALATSRNIPAITSLMTVGPDKLATAKKEIGYTVNIDPSGYGPSSALGANDVLGIEHASAYATMGSGGKEIHPQPIVKIVDNAGNVVYDLYGKDKPEQKQVLDERAVFIVNDMTNPRSATGNDSPVKFRDGRDISGKTGTSEENKDNWFVGYSPDFVALGWSGNNDNTPMSNGSFGSTNAEPWVKDFLTRVQNTTYLKDKTPYSRPGGIAKGQICGKIKGADGAEQQVCEGSSDYYIEGLTPPVYSTKQLAMVCTDQPNKLAREIDMNAGFAVEKEFTYMKMPYDKFQPYLDNWLQDKQGGNGAPKDMCDVNRSTNGENAWAIINPNSTTYTFGAGGGNIPVSVKGVAITGGVTSMTITLISVNTGTAPAGFTPVNVSGGTFDGNLVAPAGIPSGQYDIKATVASPGGNGSSTARISITGSSAANINASPATPSIATPGANVQVKGTYTGTVNSATLTVVDSSDAQVSTAACSVAPGPNTITCNWVVPAAFPAGNYGARIVGDTDTSNKVTIKIL